MKRFNDKVIVITGADSSIGRVTALKIAREGGNVVLIGSNSKVLEYIAGELPEDHTWINSGNHLAVTGDITNEEHSARLVSHIVEKYNRIDTVISINTEIKFSQALLTELSKTKGSIVNVSLLSDTSTSWSIEGYKQTQAELEKYNKQLAYKLGPQGIRVNGVHAGLTTEDSDDVDNVKLFIDQSALGRLVEMSEITEAILFLSSNDACMITGATLAVDGGLSLSN